MCRWQKFGWAMVLLTYVVRHPAAPYLLRIICLQRHWLLSRMRKKRRRCCFFTNNQESRSTAKTSQYDSVLCWCSEMFQAAFLNKALMIAKRRSDSCTSDCFSSYRPVTWIFPVVNAYRPLYPDDAVCTLRHLIDCYNRKFQTMRFFLRYNEG